jgi:chain length determinant protein (polysaccharide antigen chain regulator)
MEPKNLDELRQYSPEDEIDLFELFSSLFQQWRLLVGITVAGGLLAVVIALMLPKQYEVAAQVGLPDKFHATVLTNKGYEKQSQQGLFEQYYEKLQSFDNLSRYVKQGEWLSKIYPDRIEIERDRQLFIELKESLQIDVVEPKPKKGESVGAPRLIRLFISGKDEDVAANFINGYIEYSNKSLIDMISQTGQRLQRLETEKINRDIRLLREDYEKRLAAKLKVLNEALIVAEAVGIKKPTDMMKYDARQAENGVIIDFSNTGSELYLKGSIYLKQLIHTINSRESQDPFINKLFPLFARLNQLQAMDFNFSDVKAYKLDMPAAVDGKAEKPNGTLIVVVGGILSLFVAVFVALIAGAIKRRREQDFS